MIVLEDNALARIAPDTKAGSKGVAEYIPRADFIARLKTIVTDLGGKVGAEKLSTTQDGVSFVGCFEVGRVGGRWVNRVFQPWLGYSFSHNNRRPCFLYGGAVGRESGDVLVLSRYRLNRRLATGPLFDSAEDAVAKWFRHLPEYRGVVAALRRSWIPAAKGDSMVMEALRRDYIASSRMAKLEAIREGTAGETSYELLVKMNRVVGYHPPVSASPITDQLRRAYGCFRVIYGD